MINAVVFSSKDTLALGIWHAGGPLPGEKRWVDVGKDEADRVEFLDRVEFNFGINLSDADREGIQTVFDLQRLVDERTMRQRRVAVEAGV